jgi:protein-glutamine gamma-glutamyltransferase
MHKLSTSERFKFLTISTSLAGMLCMVLAGLLPWGLFFISAIMHVVIFLWYFDQEVIGQTPALVLITFILGLEILRISYVGRAEVVYAVRDMIIVTAIVRLFMKKTLREIYQIAGIAFAECLLSTIFTTSPLFLIGLVLMIFLLPRMLYSLDARAFSFKEKNYAKGAVHWLEISGGIILTAYLLFYMLPRPASSIIQQGFAQRARMHFDGEVDLKKPGSMGEDSIVLMRIIWTYGSIPSSFYMAGVRLEGISPDGFFKKDFRGSTTSVANGFTDRITIYPALLDSENVFFPFWLNKVSPQICLFKGSNVYWGSEAPQVYDVWVNSIPGPGNPCSIELPRELKSVGDLGVKVAGEGNVKTKTQRIATFLSKTHEYTLEKQRAPSGTSAIDWFVFSKKKGRCEHFASAAAAMIRGCGIPARVVTGFLVNEYSKNGNYFIVRASDAHAWTEYWDGTWHIIDATPARTFVSYKSFQILDELRFRWYRWVIQFSLDDQLRLAASILAPSPIITRQIESLGSYAVYLFVSGGFFYAFSLLIRNKFLPPYDKVCNALKRKKIILPTNTSHQEHLKIISVQCPSIEPAFREYLTSYLAWRFGDQDIDVKTHTNEMIKKIKGRS